jgi:hypothetical protein
VSVSAPHSIIQSAISEHRSKYIGKEDFSITVSSVSKFYQET